MVKDEFFMQRALDLALQGLGQVSPNPMVGAVVVLGEEIIGEGYHQKYGEAHAEVNAINDVLQRYKDAEEKLRQATIYVTLEPCAHFGKTPPCSDLIIRYKLSKVVVGCRDSFAEVNGKGIEKIRNAGIELDEGVLESKCLEINKRFFTRLAKQRPYIILKWAETANGYFAPKSGSQQWISGPEAKILTHKWRAEEDCVLVGKRTASVDDPKLNARLYKGRHPKRAVIDRNLELSKTLHLFDQSQETFVFNKEQTTIDGKIKYIGIEDFDHFLPQYVLFQLYLQDISSVIIEGGQRTLNQFIEAGLWDEARIFVAAKSWTDGLLAPTVNGLTASEESIGKDRLLIVKNIEQK